MIFNTAWFLGFFALFFGFSLFLPGGRVRLLYVLAGSAAFHFHFAGWYGVVPIYLGGVATYLIALAMERHAPGDPRRGRWLAAGLAVPVGILLYYKYRVLLTAPLLEAAGLSEAPWAAPFLEAPLLPLALSFFTFEYVHYLTDVHRGSPAVRKPLDFAFFALFFPSLVSGPIKRYQPFLAQVRDGLPPAPPPLVVSGLVQVLMGFSKKLLVADPATLMVREVEALPDLSAQGVLLIVLLQSVRILFDFSGYSDIAIGLGRMMGLELPANFRYPYAARDIASFWNRWHMSLSTWIRDYLYIPLGGSRQGTLRTLGNLLAAMFLCGLWHGAAWHFGLWGVWHGAGLAVHRAFDRSRWAAACRRLPLWGAFSWTLTLAFVGFGWLLFFYPLEKVVNFTRLMLRIA
jgi:alginate O-acetyltransferase complex protein AlgI